MKPTKSNRNMTDRRGFSDIWAKILTALNALSWGVILLILILTEKAKPEFESFFDRFYKLKVRTWWDLEFVDYLLWLVIAGIIASSAGLVLVWGRARRMNDPSFLGLLLMGLISVLGLIGVVFFLW